MLKTGDQAPDFSGINQNNEPVVLSDFKGKKVILYFYPKDNTPGCTAEACSLNNAYDFFLENGIVVIGVSTDSVQSHQKFAGKYALNFNLIADVDKQIVVLYDAWGEKVNYGKKYMGLIRKTFLISEEGVISHIIEKVDTKNHAEQLQKLLFPSK